MARRNTDTEKWDDDWFLELEPEMKLAWDYLTTRCDGTGQIKISLKRMSESIKGRAITREWLDEAFAFRLHWISSDRVWILGYIGFHYQNISAKNAAHRNVVRKILRDSRDWKLGERGRQIIATLAEFAGTFPDSLVRDSSEKVTSSGEPRAESARAGADSNKNKNENRNEKLSLSNEEESAPKFVVHPDLDGDDITKPVLQRIATHTQQNWLKAYIPIFGKDGLRGTIQAGVLWHSEKSGPDVQDWGLKLTTWLANEKRKVAGGSLNHGLLSAPKDPLDIDFDGIAARSQRTPSNLRGNAT